jgi:hypothetical protein
MMHERIPVQIWSPSDLRSLRWGSILLGVGVGVFLPRALRRYGRWMALGTAVLAIKPLMAMLREDSVVCSDRPLEAERAETLALAAEEPKAAPSAM